MGDKVVVCIHGGLFRIAGNANVQGLTLVHYVHKGLEGLVQGSAGVIPVGVEKVHVIQFHPFKALVQAGDEILAGSPFPVWAGPHEVSCFGGNEKFVPVRLERGGEELPEVFLRGTRLRTVVVGKVKVADALVKGKVCHFLDTLKGRFSSKVLPEAKGNCRNVYSRPAAAAVLHGAVSLRGRCITHFNAVSQLQSYKKPLYYAKY